MTVVMSHRPGCGLEMSAATLWPKPRRALKPQRQQQLQTGEAAEFDAGIDLDLEELKRRRQGRRSWQREASHQLDAHRERQADPIPRGRRERLEGAKRRLEQELAVDTAANQAYEQFHTSGRDTLGRRMGKHPKPHTPPVLPDGTVNLTDPDSRLIHDKRLTKLQGYNAQAAVSRDGQIIPRRGDPQPAPPISVTSRRCSTPRSATSRSPVSMSDPGRRCWPIPATGTASRPIRSSPPAPRY